MQYVELLVFTKHPVRSNGSRGHLGQRFNRDQLAFLERRSRGVAVLNKCANPACNAQFRYLHQGKLFEVEIKYAESPGSGGQTKAVHGKGHAERCWLCDDCAAHVTLRFDSQRGEVMVSSFRSSEETLTTLFTQSNGGPAARIVRVLIRPLDLELRASTRRRAVSELNMRTREAA